MINEDATELDTINVLRIILENSLYATSKDIIKASKILNNLKVVDDKINLEDEDFKFIKLWAETYAPLTNKGLLFVDFFKQLEE